VICVAAILIAVLLAIVLLGSTEVKKMHRWNASGPVVLWDLRHSVCHNFHALHL
jgi:hypothetical protein